MAVPLGEMLPTTKEESSDDTSGSFKPVGRFISGFRTLCQWLLYVKLSIPFIKDIHLNFIFFHYLYVISWTIIGSVILYPGGNLRYIDALFFSSASASQSGLNTVDGNKLYTYQQITIYIETMFTTPIFVHSCLVFFRLYWFEKRFENVVHDAKRVRRTRSKAITMTRSKEQNQDADREERGVRNQPIVVLRNAYGDARGGEMSRPVSKTPDDAADSEAGSAESPSGGHTGNDDNDDETKSAPNPELRLGLGSLQVPTQLSPEHHIAFLEKQRKDKGALRIPSPREYDRGGAPQTVEEEDGDDNNKPADRRESEPLSPHENQRIMFSEPNLTRSRTGGTTLNRSDTRGSGRLRPLRRAQPLRRMRGTLTQEKDRSTLPYLSWNATVGRNSRFIDLTEEQRNELGGIEYRALKTLAMVLISYYFFFHIFGLISLVGWIMCNHRWGSAVEQDGIGRPWWGVFTAQSAFNDLGITLTPDSMQSFEDGEFPLLLMSFLILVGNTAFPCMLRLIIWVVSKIVQSGSALWEELRFLLDHPRRCFTLLFPRNATWWLFVILIILNFVDWIIFIILDVSISTSPRLTSRKA